MHLGLDPEVGYKLYYNYSVTHMSSNIDGNYWLITLFSLWSW